VGLAAANLPAPPSAALRTPTRARPPAMLAAPPQRLADRRCDCGAPAKLSGRCGSCDRTALLPGRRPAEPLPPLPAMPAPGLALRDRLPLGQALAAPLAHNLGHLRVHPAGPPPVVRVPVQTQLRVSAPGDAAESEAQEIGRCVARMPAPPPAGAPVLRLHGPRAVQRRAAQPIAATAAVARGLEETRGSGVPLPQPVRAFMEPRFGADFSNVRLHAGPEAAALSTQLHAHAFTHGRDVYFNAGQFRPETQAGRELIAHELAHTIQQGGVVQRAAVEPPVLTIQRSDGVQRQAAASPAKQGDRSAQAVTAGRPDTSSGLVEISSGAFSPSQPVKEEIDAQGTKGLGVRMRAKGLTGEGIVKLRSNNRNSYDSIARGSLPLTTAFAQQLGGMYLNFDIVNGEIRRGFASLHPGGPDPNDWLKAIQKDSSLLEGAGLKVLNLPSARNSFEGGHLKFGASNIKVEIGGFIGAAFDINVEDAGKPQIKANASIIIKGLAKGEINLDNTTGKLSGQTSLTINYKSFAGAVIVKYNADGGVDVGGNAAYTSDKLSGEIQFVATDEESATKFAHDAVAAAGGLENVQNAAAPGPVPAPKAGRKDRALAATGQLSFNLTKWFAGTVNVVVDGAGGVTVIGRIVPPAEIELFKQKDWNKQLFKLEVRAYYGIPVVGDLNLFANISLHALAKLGPAKIYNIEILGTYSTNQTIQKNIQISGSINVSAYGGLMLRAEGGAGVEIVEHDIKFGIGLNADVGVKAYADARPTVGYRDPGVFYISGDLDFVAQPVLGLGGDFFVALEAPWWSPISDHRWTWPLFSKDWPLTDPIGIGASIKDYELGSGKVPEIDLKPPAFDPSKFMTSMVDKTLPDSPGGAGAAHGTFKDDGTAPAPVVPPKKPAPKVVASKPPKRAAPLKGGKSASPDPKAALERQNAKALQMAARRLAALRNKGASTRVALDQELTRIKAQGSGVDFIVKSGERSWLVTPQARGRAGKGIEVPSKQVEGKDELPTGQPVSVKVPFSMRNHSHTLRVTISSTSMRADMASSDGDLFEKIKKLKGHVEAKKELSEKERARIVEYLSNEQRKLLDPNAVKDAYAKFLGEKFTVLKPTPQFVRQYTLKIVSDIVQFSKLFGFTDLVVTAFVPDPLPRERYIPEPVRSNIRGRLYERGSNWDPVRERVFRAGATAIDNEIAVRIVSQLSTGGNASAEAMKDMKSRGKVLDTATLSDFKPGMSYVAPREALYAVDHDPSLAEHWTKLGGNMSSDAARRDAVEGKAKVSLDLVTRRFNSQKSSRDLTGELHKFKQNAWVGPGFMSEIAKDVEGVPSNEKAVTIDDHSLTYKDGTPFIPTG
jgi:hypothetical protein